VLFVGHDWAEDHHDIALVNEAGRRLASVRLPDGVEGVARLHTLVLEHADDEVVVGTETDRGLFVAAMVAAGYVVYAINPKAVDRYRDRHRQAGGKSDASDARVLADIVRLDREMHRRVAADSPAVEAIKVLARAHKELIWQRQAIVNQLRAGLREYFPAALGAFGDELWHPDAIAVLSVAPTPSTAAALRCDRIAGALRRSGRRRYIEHRARQIHEAFASDQLTAPADITSAFGDVTAALLAVTAGLNQEIGRLEAAIAPRLRSHTDGHVMSSMPGLGVILAARVLGEFGDDPDRYADAKARKNYAGTSPITRQSGKLVLVAGRRARNQRLADACYRWAFCSLHASEGARRYYDAQRDRGKSHHAALWALANRWVGILHGCLRQRRTYDEHTAWAHHFATDKTGAA
jgi:transposase